MEFSPSKRRKISSTTSVPHDAPTVGEKDGEVRTTPRRASYLSPTKASLARFNHNLLPQHTTAHNRVRNSSGHVNGIEVTGVDEVGANNDLATHHSGVSQDGAPPEYPTERPLASIVLNGHTGLAAPARRSRTPSTDIHIGIRPSSNGSNVRASPPDAARAAPDVGHATLGKQLESQLQESIAGKEELGAKITNHKPMSEIAQNFQEDEPQLPPTPDYLLQQAEQRPPKGLLLSSPSRRQKPRRKKGFGASSSGVTSSTSPLKSRDTPQPKGMVENPASLRLQLHFPDADTHHASTIAQRDPDVLQRRQELDRLRVQLQAIQGQVTQLETTATHLPDLPFIEQVPQQAKEELLESLSSHDPIYIAPVTSPNKKRLADRLSRFLPFSNRPALSASAYSPILSPPSLKPLELLNPVPYLNLFSPLSFTCTPARIIPSSINMPLSRCQSVTLASAYRILIMKLEVTTDVSTQKITNLVIQEMSPFAESELGPWIRARAVEREVTAIAWAMGRYWDIAVIRARCWSICEKQFGQLLSFTGVNSIKNLVHPEKDAGKVLSPPDDNHRDLRNDASGLEDQPNSEEPISKARLQFHVGRQSIFFTRHNISLLVTWRISFDWIGEVQSNLKACVGYPESWTQIDERGSLQHIGKLFDILVKSKGVSQAIDIVVGLLFLD